MASHSAHREATIPNIVLKLGSFKGTESILTLSENSGYTLEPSRHDDDAQEAWKADQIDELTGLCPAFQFGQHEPSPTDCNVESSEGPDERDLEISHDNTTCPSVQFSDLDITPDTHLPRLEALPRNPIQIMMIDSRSDQRIKHLIGSVLGRRQNITSSVTIDLGQVNVRAWHPTFSGEAKARFLENAGRFNNEYVNALPRTIGPSTLRGSMTWNIRFGKRGVSKAMHGAQTSSGSLVSVSKVRHPRSGRVFAAKIRRLKTSDATRVVRGHFEPLREEFDRIKKSLHLTIATAHGVFIGGDSVEAARLITTWIECDLASAILSFDDIPKLLFHLSNGLNFIHESGLTHRDLKPANVLLQMSEDRLIRAKIADFGISKPNLSQDMHSHVGIGVYMAPELFRESRSDGQIVDMWSLGVIAVERWTDWEAQENAWDPRGPPTADQQNKWVCEILKPRIATAVAKSRELLRGLLESEPEMRWDAARSSAWLLENWPAVAEEIF